MKKLLYTAALICAVSGTFAQASGYLGKKNHVQILVCAAPTLKHQNFLKDITTTEQMKFANMSYQASFSRVFTSNFELSLGYQFASMNGISDGVRVQGTLNSSPVSIVDDPKLTFHGAYVDFNFYRRGSLAPMGKYYGFQFAYGNTTLAGGEPVIIGSKAPFTSSSAFKSTATVNDIETIQIPEQKVSSFHFKLRVGRTYPISDFMMIYGGMTFPLLSYYSSNNQSKFGFSINAERDVEDSNDWANYTMATARFYNLISIETGIRFLF